jgi:hypothetical protein
MPSRLPRTVHERRRTHLREMIVRLHRLYGKGGGALGDPSYSIVRWNDLGIVGISQS